MIINGDITKMFDIYLINIDRQLMEIHFESFSKINYYEKLTV